MTAYRRNGGTQRGFSMIEVLISLVLIAGAMLGQAVSLQVDKDTTAQGIVSAVQIEAGTPQLMVGGQAFALSQVLSVARPPAAN